MEFERKHVGRAADDLIASAEDRAQTASYSRTLEAAGLASTQDLPSAATATRFILNIENHCADHGLPPLDAVVVNMEDLRKASPVEVTSR